MRMPRVVVPVGLGVELDEPHAPLDQAAGDQALPAEAIGVRLVEAVQSPDGLGLGPDVEDPGGLHLHAERQLERLDPRSSRLSSSRSRRCRRLSSLTRSSWRRCWSPDNRSLPRLAIGSLQVGDARPLVGRRKKARAPEGRIPSARADRHEPGQVLVLAAQPVEQPRAQAGTGEDLLAREHLEAGVGVIDVVGDHRANHAQVVDAGGQVGQQRR